MERNESHNMNFVTIELSKKQVDMKHPRISETNGKTYLRIISPEGGILFYPAESIKVKEKDPSRVTITRPEGTELQLHFSKRVEGVPDTAPKEEQYQNYTKTVTIEDLKEMYEESRKSFVEYKQSEEDANQSQFVNMTVPTEWGKDIISNGRDYVSIRVPVKDENEQSTYYSFIVPKERFHESDKQDGLSYFGFPRKRKDDETQDFVITLRTSKKLPDGSYENSDRDISSTQLKEYVEAAKEQKKFKDNLIGVEISEKLVHYFEGKENSVEYARVSVPLGNEFVQIIIKRSSILDSEKDGKVYLSMFKNGTDGSPYTFTATQGIKQANGEWKNVEIEITSEEVVDSFSSSREQYKQEHMNDEQGKSLADELNEENPFLGGR